MAARCTETDSENTALIDKGLAIREKIAVEAEKYLNISQENEKEVGPEALSEKDIKQRILDTQILSDLQNLTSREVKEQMILTVPLKEKRKRKEKSHDLVHLVVHLQTAQLPLQIQPNS